MQLLSTLTLLASLASLVASLPVSQLVGRQQCPEAARFGDFELVPFTLKPGDVCLFHFSRLVYLLMYIPAFHHHSNLQLFCILWNIPRINRLLTRGARCEQQRL